MEKAREICSVVGMAVHCEDEMRRTKCIPADGTEKRALKCKAIPGVTEVSVYSYDTIREIVAASHADVVVVSPEYGERPAQKNFLMWLSEHGIARISFPRTPGISSTALRSQVQQEESASK